MLFHPSLLSAAEKKNSAIVSQILIQHRAPDDKLELVKRILAPLKSRFVYLSYEEHDEVTANTQAVTHAAFMRCVFLSLVYPLPVAHGRTDSLSPQSMGTAWRCSSRFPWETGRYVGGLEVAKINITLRIYSSKWHVYAGLAILNPAARRQIGQFSQSVTELFKLMISEDEEGLRKRVWRARDFVFGQDGKMGGPGSAGSLFVSDTIFDRFTIGEPSTLEPPPPNSHLALLAIVDCWYSLRIRPFLHLELAATPIFRMWFGVAEYLFRDEARLEAAIKAAVWEKRFRSDDLEFTVAARGWSECISFGNFEWYRHRFEETAAFFEPRFEESRKQTSSM
jgi:prephenate dehydrogenase (NADP+)